VVYHRLDVVGRATNQERLVLTRQNIFNGSDGLLLELRDGIRLLEINYIQQVVADQCTFLCCHLGRADIQTPIDLARVSRDNLSMKLLCQGDTQAALTGRCWTENDN